MKARHSLILSILFFAYTADAHTVKISEKKSFKLDGSTWEKGSGSLHPGTKIVNVFSNKKSKTFQIFYEDNIIPLAAAKTRLSKECQSLLKDKSGFCQTADKAVGDAKAIKLTSLLSVPQKNILKVRSFYITGSQAQLDELLSSVVKQ